MLLDWTGFCWPAAFYFVVFHHVPCEVVRNVWQISSVVTDWLLVCIQ